MKINRQTYDSIIALAGKVGALSDAIDEYTAVALDFSESLGKWLDNFAESLITQAEESLEDEPVGPTVEDIKQRVREAMERAQQPKITNVDDFIAGLFKRETDDS